MLENVAKEGQPILRVFALRQKRKGRTFVLPFRLLDNKVVRIFFGDSADDAALRRTFTQRGEQFARPLFCDGKQKTAGGLRICDQVDARLLCTRLDEQVRCDKVHVAVSTRGDDAHFGKALRAFKKREGTAVQADGDAAAVRHLEGMADKTKARDIGTRVQSADSLRRSGGGRVERCHAPYHRRVFVSSEQLRLRGGGEDARAERFCEDEDIARTRANIFEDLVGMDIAGDAQTVLRLVILDRVAAGDDAAGLDRLIVSALQNTADSIKGKAGRNAQKVHRERRLSAHRVHIAQGIRGGDLSKLVGVVDDRGEEVDGVDRGEVISELVNARVIARVESDDELWVDRVGKTRQNFRKDTRSQLGRSPRGSCQLGKGNIFFHDRTSFPLSKRVRHYYPSSSIFSARW